MPFEYNPLIQEVKEKLGMYRYIRPVLMENRRSNDPYSPLRDHERDINMTKVAADSAIILGSDEDPSPYRPSDPAYYDLTPLHNDVRTDSSAVPGGTFPSVGEGKFLNNFYTSLLVLDGAYDAVAAVEAQFVDGETPMLKKAAKKKGYVDIFGKGDVNAYKNALIQKSIDSVAGRSTVLGSVIISAFKGLLYFFRPVIHQIISDYLKGESTVRRRGRQLTNFEILFKDALQRDESTGTTGNSYLVSLIQAETGQREDLAGVAYDSTEFGTAFTGDLDDLR